MPRRGRDMIIMSTGPYKLDQENVESVLPHVCFRHYKKDEIETAKRFIQQLILPGDYYFDVVVHTWASMHIINEMAPLDIVDVVPWAKRIDAVVETRDSVHVLEFKERMGDDAIGQLLIYQQLYGEQYKPNKPIEMGVVISRDDPTYHKLLKKLKIKSWVV